MRGPFPIREGSYGSTPYTKSATSYRQDHGTKMRKPLPYDSSSSLIISPNVYPNSYSTVVGHKQRQGNGLNELYGFSAGKVPSLLSRAHSKAYSRWTNVLGASQLQLANDFHERYEAIETAVALLKASRHPFSTFASQCDKLFRRGKFSPSSALKNLGDAWLTFNFGVKPTIQSVYDLMSLLQMPMPDLIVKASASVTDEFVVSQDKYNYDGYYNRASKGRVKVAVKYGARVTVSNPNLYLLNEAGLANPASFLWEATPYSWLVDYMVNVGQVLQSYSDYVGLSLVDPYVTEYLHSVSISDIYYVKPYSGKAPAFHGTARVERTSMRRKLEKPTAKLTFNPRFSLSRVANMASVAIRPLILVNNKMAKMRLQVTD